MKKLLFPILLLAILSGCKKDDNSPEYHNKCYLEHITFHKIPNADYLYEISLENFSGDPYYHVKDKKLAVNTRYRLEKPADIGSFMESTSWKYINIYMRKNASSNREQICMGCFNMSKHLYDAKISFENDTKTLDFDLEFDWD